MPLPVGDVLLLMPLPVGDVLGNSSIKFRLAWQALIWIMISSIPKGLATGLTSPARLRRLGTNG
jgi:hypothetical protein